MLKKRKPPSFHDNIIRVRSVDLSYTSFSILKRNGLKRLIEAPNPALRDLQRDLLEQLKPIPISPFSFGISRGALAAAPAHLRSVAMLKMDIENFFNSISFEMLVKSRIIRKIQRRTGLDADLACKCLFVTRGTSKVLAQGSPTSPLLADLYLTTLDYKIARTLQTLARYYDIAPINVAYTRYMDDLIVSVAGVSEGRAFAYCQSARKWIEKHVIERALRLADGKTIVKSVSRASSGIVLGYSILGNSVQVPRSVRSRARAICWKLANGTPTTNEERGILAYALSGRLRIPRGCIELAKQRRDTDAVKLVAWSNRKTTNERDINLCVTAILGRGSLKRFVKSPWITPRIKSDLKNAIDADLLTVHIDAGGTIVSPTRENIKRILGLVTIRPRRRPRNPDYDYNTWD